MPSPLTAIDSEESGERPRASARRPNRGPAAGPGNRAALIAAAREVFAEQGPSAAFNAIAQRAGVGQGSLYRHFPDKLAIVLAVYEENQAALERFASDPDHDLRSCLDLITDFAMTSVALNDVAAASPEDQRMTRVSERIAAVLDAKLPAARDAATVAHHVTVDDLLLAIALISAAVAQARSADRPQIARAGWALMFAGLAP